MIAPDKIVPTFFLTVDGFLEDLKEVKRIIGILDFPSGCVCKYVENWYYEEDEECGLACHCDAANVIYDYIKEAEALEKILKDYLDDWFDLTGAIWEVSTYITWERE